MQSAFPSRSPAIVYSLIFMRWVKVFTIYIHIEEVIPLTRPMERTACEMNEFCKLSILFVELRRYVMLAILW